jgi:hypothetical protein
VNALACLIAAFGKARDQLFVFSLKDPEHGIRRPVAPAVTAHTYDPKPAAEMLERIVGELGVGDFSVSSAIASANQPGKFSLSVTFTIHVRTDEDFIALTIPSRGTSPTSYMTIIGALGTLYRARANKEGFGVQLDVFRG